MKKLRNIKSIPRGLRPSRVLVASLLHARASPPPGGENGETLGEQAEEAGKRKLRRCDQTGGITRTCESWDADDWIGSRKRDDGERERMVLDRLGAWIKRVRKEEGGRQVERRATSRRRGLHGFLCVHVHARAFVNAR